MDRKGGLKVKFGAKPTHLYIIGLLPPPRFCSFFAPSRQPQTGMHKTQDPAKTYNSSTTERVATTPPQHQNTTAAAAAATATKERSAEEKKK